ncbi:hypothetical protein AMELA_G00123860 [Ameiurus melas]|uniref:Sodium/calcium exchanger membrane region domain-containing protein n=1 Tax=Ameiurus melas TaxID=219545 RepID=A0A7J6APL3_AMEME|nr:hypothetical protein AMELA_G00123860 [Ameiurus melas]
MQASNGVDGTLVADGKGEKQWRTAAYPEDKLTEEEDNELSSPFTIPGLGDMAVPNTIGSNVFDILIGLGVPWGLQTMAVNYGSVVKINSRGLVYSVVLLLGSVALTVLGIHVNRWKLDLKLGVYVLLLYTIFLCFSILIEYNIFTFVNLPMCQRSETFSI